jgi:hypothetical protein
MLVRSRPRPGASPSAAKPVQAGRSESGVLASLAADGLESGSPRVVGVATVAWLVYGLEATGRREE